jgi:hypothetical protein
MISLFPKETLRNKIEGLFLKNYIINFIYVGILILFIFFIESKISYLLYFFFGTMHGIRYMHSNIAKKRPRIALLIYVLGLWIISNSCKLIFDKSKENQEFIMENLILTTLGFIGFMIIGYVIRIIKNKI